VLGENSKELNPRTGAKLGYACSIIGGNNLECVAQNGVGELPKGTAAYVLSPTEHPRYSGGTGC
jgi:hypothetical protein